MSQFNAFVKANLPAAFTKAGAVATFNASSLIAAQGTLQGFEDLEFDTAAGRDISYTWTDNTGGSGANASDKVLAVVVSASGADIAAVDIGGTRSDTSGSIAIPGSWSIVGARVAFYFVTADGSAASDSQNMPVA